MVKEEVLGQKRENYATHFGPEPEDVEITRAREKQKTMVFKDSILNQIKKNEVHAKHDRDLMLAFENQVVDASNEKLRDIEQKKADKAKEQKQYYSEVWKHQMRVNADKKSIVAAAGEK